MAGGEDILGAVNEGQEDDSGSHKPSHLKNAEKVTVPKLVRGNVGFGATSRRLLDLSESKQPASKPVRKVAKGKKVPLMPSFILP